jgi:arylsulfatase A-like enzyme
MNHLAVSIALALPLFGIPPSLLQDRPNILIIMTDDQRATQTVTTRVMDATRVLFQDEGTKFTRAFATTPLCCPSRASLLTGQYAHNHGVRRNEDMENLDQATTIQRYMQEAGYLTGIVGKFLNEWPLDTDPPYFDRWSLIAKGHFDPAVNRDGAIKQESGYSTDITATESLRILEAFEAEDDRPWMLLVWPRAPHGSFQPAPRYADAPVGSWNGNPAVKEKDLSDKPPYVKNDQNPTSLSDGRTIRRGQLRMLLSVDDLISTLFGSMEESGEEALSFFLSDNGFMWGEHKQQAKSQAYNHSVRIPFYIRWPERVPAGKLDERIVANIDLVPTIFDVAGIEPGHVVDGKSIFGPYKRQHLLIESWNTVRGIPRWFQYRAADRWYAEYRQAGRVVFREHYNLVNDPWELQNKAADGQLSQLEQAMSLHIAEDRHCTGGSCP